MTTPARLPWYQTTEAYLRANIICYGLEKFATDYPEWHHEHMDEVHAEIYHTVNTIRFQGMKELDVVTITAGLTKFVKHVLVSKKGIYSAITYPFSTDKILFDAAELCDAISFDSQKWWDFQENFVASVSDNMDDCAATVFNKLPDWERDSENFARKSAHYFFRMMMSLEFGRMTWHYHLQDAIDCLSWYLVAQEWQESSLTSQEDFNRMRWSRRQEIAQILSNYISRKTKNKAEK